MTIAAVHREQINDRGKLLFHRLVARRLKHEPELIETAREYILRYSHEDGGKYPALLEWDDILRQDVGSVCRLIVGRDANLNRLRLSSPFAFMPEFTIRDEAARRKLWRIAKKGLVRKA